VVLGIPWPADVSSISIVICLFIIYRNVFMNYLHKCVYSTCRNVYMHYIQKCICSNYSNFHALYTIRCLQYVH
jgi:type IV secretory pathway VirB3-like protein